MEFLFELDDSRGEMYDDGEELGDEYLFFVHAGSESDLLSIAREIGMPLGVYATATDTEADMGGGRRVDLD